MQPGYNCANTLSKRRRGETEVNTSSDEDNLPEHPSEEGPGRFDLLVGFGHQLHGLLLFARVVHGELGGERAKVPQWKELLGEEDGARGGGGEEEEGGLLLLMLRRPALFFFGRIHGNTSQVLPPAEKKIKCNELFFIFPKILKAQQ